MEKETFIKLQLFAEGEEDELTDDDAFDDDDDYYDDEPDYDINGIESDGNETDDKEGNGNGSDDDGTIKNNEQNGKKNDIDIQAILKEAYERGLREGKSNGFIGKVNTFTGEQIESKADAEIFEEMLEIEKNGGNPIEDFYKHVRDKRKADAESYSAREKRTAERNNEMQTFIATNPDVDLSKVFADPIFQKVAKGRLGNAPFNEIYSDYTDTVDMVNKQKKNAVNKMKANNNATPGSLSGGTFKIDKPISELSDEEFERLHSQALAGKLTNRR